MSPEKFFLLIAFPILICFGYCEQKKEQKILASMSIGREVSAKEFGDAWIFTVPSGHVYSRKDNSAIFDTGTKKYGMNGRAMDSGYEDIHSIWIREKGEFGGEVYKGNIRPFMDLALSHSDIPH